VSETEHDRLEARVERLEAIYDAIDRFAHDLNEAVVQFRTALAVNLPEPEDGNPFIKGVSDFYDRASLKQEP
jgi:hypothetical protein